MITRVYKLKFHKSSFDLSDDYEMLSEYEKERISELDAETYFDYDCDIDDCYVCYVITKPMDIENYLVVLRNNSIGCDCIDLSKDVLSRKVNLLDDLREFVTQTTKVKWSFFVDELNDWIYNNLDIDTILDRISDVGIESLSNVEKEFLKTYN